MRNKLRYMFTTIKKYFIASGRSKERNIRTYVKWTLVDEPSKMKKIENVGNDKDCIKLCFLSKDFKCLALLYQAEQEICTLLQRTKTMIPDGKFEENPFTNYYEVTCGDPYPKGMLFDVNCYHFEQYEAFHYVYKVLLNLLSSNAIIFSLNCNYILYSYYASLFFPRLFNPNGNLKVLRRREVRISRFKTKYYLLYCYITHCNESLMERIISKVSILDFVELVLNLNPMKDCITSNLTRPLRLDYVVSSIYIIKQMSHDESESGCVRVKTIVSLLNRRRYLDAV